MKKYKSDGTNGLRGFVCEKNINAVINADLVCPLFLWQQKTLDAYFTSFKVVNALKSGKFRYHLYKVKDEPKTGEESEARYSCALKWFDDNGYYLFEDAFVKLSEIESGKLFFCFTKVVDDGMTLMSVGISSKYDHAEHYEIGIGGIKSVAIDLENLKPHLSIGMFDFIYSKFIAEKKRV